MDDSAVAPVWPDWLVPADDRWEDDGAGGSARGLDDDHGGDDRQNQPDGDQRGHDRMPQTERCSARAPGRRASSRLRCQIELEVVPFDGRLAVGRVGPELDFDM